MSIQVTDQSTVFNGIVFIPKDGATTIEFLDTMRVSLCGQTIIGKEL